MYELVDIQRNKLQLCNHYRQNGEQVKRQECVAQVGMHDIVSQMPYHWHIYFISCLLTTDSGVAAEQSYCLNHSARKPLDQLIVL